VEPCIKTIENFIWNVYTPSNEVCKPSAVLKSFLIRFLEFVHDMYTIWMKFENLCSLMCTSVGQSTLWIESFLSDFRGERNKVWRISTKLFSFNTEGRPEWFLSCTLPVSRKRFSRWDTVDLFGTGESGNVSQNHSGNLSKNEMTGSVRQWTLVAVMKKTSLHFDCFKTTDGLARAGYNMTWPAWALV
jgi:hypothetical protein